MLTSSHETSINPGTTAHVVKDTSVITGKAVILDTSIGTAGQDTAKRTDQRESVIKRSGGEKPATLNFVLHAPGVKHSRVSVWSLCNDSHTTEFMDKNYVVKNSNCVLGVSERMCRMPSVNLQRVRSMAMSTVAIIRKMMSV